ncbi:hypothetical protein HMPREF9613_01449 [Cutibacterium acnes HL002PA1]|nr:hypothetical protein HMPREF9613_01449 [Cutibacterium acnes HL002PA1]
MDAVKATKEPPDVTVNVVNHSAPLDLACRGPLVTASVNPLRQVQALDIRII